MSSTYGYLRAELFPYPTPRCPEVNEEGRQCIFLTGHTKNPLHRFLSNETWYWANSGKTCHIPKEDEVYHQTHYNWVGQNQPRVTMQCDFPIGRSICYQDAVLEFTDRNQAPELLTRRRNAPRQYFECPACKKVLDGLAEGNA